MRRRKLKGFVLPAIYSLVVVCLFLTVYFLNNSLNFQNQNPQENLDYVMSSIKDKEQNDPVINNIEEKASKPFNKENVNVSKSFYGKDDEVEQQQKSLIFYENTYMQNTGVLYNSEEQFEVIASVGGIVKDVKNDEILGSVVIIEYNSKVTTTYYSLSDVKVKTGDTVKQNDVIGTSGTNKLENELQNCLLFEVYIEGNLKNPVEFYEMNLDSLK